MATAPRKRRLGRKARRALELLGSNSLGVTEAVMLARGFTGTVLTGIVRAGLATARREVIEAGGTPIKFERYRITTDGRRALKG